MSLTTLWFVTVSRTIAPIRMQIRKDSVCLGCQKTTWFKHLRLVDPPNSDNVRVCSEHITEQCFIVDNASCYGVQEDKKEA